MSRSRHNKSTPVDYWGRRPLGSGWGGKSKKGGRWTKTRTHRLERRIADREVRQVMEQNQ